MGDHQQRFSVGKDWKNWTQYKLDTSKEDERTIEYMSYAWAPKSCVLPEFNAKVFAEKLGKNALYIVGDSLSDQQFVALACALGAQIQSVGQAASMFIAQTSNDMVSERRLPDPYLILYDWLRTLGTQPQE